MFVFLLEKLKVGFLLDRINFNDIFHSFTDVWHQHYGYCCSSSIEEMHFGLDRSFGMLKITCFFGVTSSVVVSVSNCLLWFLQRVSIACYAERCISHSKSVRLSVRLSVTRWHWVKTTQATIMGSSLKDSPMTLVSSTLDFTAKFQREHGERGRQMREG